MDELEDRDIYGNIDGTINVTGSRPTPVDVNANIIDLATLGAASDGGVSASGTYSGGSSGVGGGVSVPGNITAQVEPFVKAELARIQELYDKGLISPQQKAVREAQVIGDGAFALGMGAEEVAKAVNAVYKTYGVDAKFDGTSVVNPNGSVNVAENPNIGLVSRQLGDIKTDSVPKSSSIIDAVSAGISVVGAIGGSGGGSDTKPATTPPVTTPPSTATAAPQGITIGNGSGNTPPGYADSPTLAELGANNATTPVNTPTTTPTTNPVTTPDPNKNYSLSDLPVTIGDGAGTLPPGYADSPAAPTTDNTTNNGAQTDEQRIGEIIQSEMDDVAKKEALQNLADEKGISMSDLGVIAAATFGAAVIGNLFGGNGSGGNGSGGNGATDNGGTTTDNANNNGGDAGGTDWASIIAGAGSILSAWLGYKAAGDAADAQAAAANRALDIFEKNAGIATTKINESTNTALSQIAVGADASKKNITDSSQAARDVLYKGGNVARDDIISARDSATQTLLDAFGLQKDEINATAIASSALVSAAREKSVAALTSGFRDAIAGVESARDLSNKIIQDSTDTAEGKIDIARAGAIAAQDRGLAAIRSDFQPYLDAGKVTVEGLEKLINDPQTQRDFILNNPYFDEFANQTERRLLANQTAKGRVGTGETGLELRNRLLEYGNQLLNTAIAQRQALVNTGINAAANVGNAEIARANAVAGIEKAAGESLAQLVQTAGINKANITTNAGNTIANLSTQQGQAVADTETQAGKDLATIESNRGTNVATLTGNSASQIANVGITAGNNLATIATSTAGKLADSYTTEGTNLANINTAATNASAGLEANRGINEANILTGNAANTADVVLGQGNATAAGTIGQADQLKNGLLDLATIAINPTKFNVSGVNA